MDQGDREIYLEEQVGENTCLDNIDSAMEMVFVVAGVGPDTTELRGVVEGLLKRIAVVRAEGLKRDGG